MTYQPDSHTPDRMILYEYRCERIPYAHSQSWRGRKGERKAMKCNLIVVVLSFNGVPGYDQIEVDSLFSTFGFVRLEGSVKLEK